jgi:hypothetical protein
MKRFLSYALLLLLGGCVVIPTYKQRSSIRTLETYKRPSVISEIVIIGSGKSGSRLFIENLYNELALSLEKLGIHSRFVYLTDLKLLNSSLANEIENVSGAYMIFKPSDSALLNTNKMKVVALSPVAGAALYGNQFIESFTISVGSAGFNKPPVWKAVINVDLDIAVSREFVNLSEMIVSEMLRQRVIATTTAENSIRN